MKLCKPTVASGSRNGKSVKTSTVNMNLKKKVKGAFKKTYALEDRDEKETGQDNTSKNGNVFKDSLCLDQNLLIKSLI